MIALLVWITPLLLVLLVSLDAGTSSDFLIHLSTGLGTEVPIIAWETFPNRWIP